MKNHKFKGWKNPFILLVSLGISNIGDFIYLIAINIMVYNVTSGSAAAVAGLWIIAPLINILTKVWTGSFIDYRSKKKIIILTYFLRAIFIMAIPFAPNLLVIYTILIFLSIAQSFFSPASMTYTTMIVPEIKRKRFNSIRSVTSSGAFIIGPAVGGTLILLTNIHITLLINSLFFVIAALLLLFLPEKEKISKVSIPKLTVEQIYQDFKVVYQFMENNKYVTFIYLGYIIIMLFAFAMDAQEVVFIQSVIGLNETDYSFLISITGIGSVVGATILTLISNRISIKLMITIGVMMMALGYLLYAFSWSFVSVAVGFIFLGFFNVFLNSGITTFYQNNIPIEKMGRITSIFQLVQSSLQVVFILTIGIIADVISLRYTIVSLSLLMFIVSFIFTVSVFNKKNALHYQEANQNINI
ncbi:MFS transporter [Cytobacillus horneckiae]|uniref:MFS transporter n=1 Tax=Cytobacillus horneckiae TaxID=549687 RepID=UPI0039A23F72